MAGKYVRLKRDFEQYKHAADQLVERLTGMIAKSLADGADPEGH